MKSHKRAQHLFIYGEMRMKETFKRELTNILFLVLIVAAAVIIYLLSRGPTAGTQIAAQAAIATPAPAAPSDTPQPTEKPLGVPESVFLTHLASSDVYSSERAAQGPRSYVVAYNESTLISAKLQYELKDGCISSVELTFLLPEKYKTKGSTPSQRILYDTAKQLERTLPEGLPAVLCDVMPACCEGDTLQASNVRYWAEQALMLKKTGDKFEDKVEDYRFLAYRSKDKSTQELVCVLILAKS